MLLTAAVFILKVVHLSLGAQMRIMILLTLISFVKILQMVIALLPIKYFLILTPIIISVLAVQVVVVYNKIRTTGPIFF